MMSESQALLAELDVNLQRTSSSQHVNMLRRVTDLFLNGAQAFSGDHVAVFDDVIGRLMEKADRPALAELSNSLASLENAPANVIDRLAHHDDIAIAGPILQNSTVVTDGALAEVAAARSEKHLAAIASRPQISVSVTDALVGRCSLETARKITDNRDASISEVGFVKLINRAKSDKALATAIEGRTDLPPELQPFLKLTLA